MTNNQSNPRTAPEESVKTRLRLGILWRTIAHSWLVAVVTLCLFSLAVIPQQKKSLLANLESRADLVASSVAREAGASIVGEDYRAVGGHCTAIVGQTKSVLFVVLTRKDGFSLVFTANGWSTRQLDARRTAHDAIAATGHIDRAEFAEPEAYHYIVPLRYSGRDWGWIHVGLPTDEYHHELRSAHKRLALLGVLCLLAGLVATVFYARRLVRPIRQLTETTDRIAGGDLSARVEVSSGDEIEALADSFNRMTGNLQQVHQQLQAAHDYTQSILQSMSDILMVRSNDGGIVTVNKATCLVLGYDENELLGHAFESVCPDVEVFSHRGSETRAPQRKADLETLLLARDGTRIPVMLSRSEIKAPDGSVMGAVFIGRDLREAKRAEQTRRLRDRQIKGHKNALARLASQSALYSGNLEAASCQVTEAAAEALAVAEASLWLYTEDRASALCLDCYKSSAKRHEKRNVMRIADFPFYFASLEIERSVAADDARRDPRTRGLTEVFLIPQGTTSTLDAPVRAGGKVVGVLHLAQAGPRRIWTLEEQNFAGSIADLVSLALEACKRKKVQEELKAAKEAAEASNKAKSCFLAYMSHEIRTPMNAVVAMLRLLSKTPLDYRQRRYVTTASISTDALFLLVEDVLEFAKLEAGKLHLEKSDFNLPDVVDSAIQVDAGVAQGKRLELASHIPQGVPRSLRGDPRRLHQVIRILVANAVKFTAEGEVIVSVSSILCNGDRIKLQFTVSDTGTGIPEERRKTLFQAFAPAGTSAMHACAETGFGLAVCKELVKLMGGEIGVVSNLGRGSTFWFTVELESAETAEEKPDIVPSEVREVRVLVVDDSASIREILVEQLSSWGCTAAAAASGSQGLEMMRSAGDAQTPFHLALVDRDMPGMDGGLFARNVREDAALRETRLILLDSICGMSDQEAAGIGFAACLIKPIRQSDLFNTMTGILRADRAKPADNVDTKNTEVAGPEKAHGHVLLAEDNPVSREVVTEVLRLAGYRCTCVATGKEAMKAALTRQFDLILMDCEMPEMDGFEATAGIRVWERERASGNGCARIPIVALTANALKGDRGRCLKAGMDDYIAKPLDPDQMIQLIGRYLGGSNSEESLADGKSARFVKSEPRCESGETERTDMPIDYESLLAEWDGNAEFVTRMLETFLRETTRDVTELKDACRAGDATRIARLAHRIKGSAGELGAQALRSQAASLETIGRASDLSQAADRMAALQAEFDRLCARIMEVAL